MSALTDQITSFGTGTLNTLANNSYIAPQTKPLAYAGAQYYNPTTGVMEIFDGTSWIPRGEVLGVTDNSQISGSGSNGSGSGSGSSYSPEDLAYIDNQMSLADQLEARIASKRQTGLTGIQEGYQSGVNQATDSRTRAQRDYNDTLERTGLAEQRAIGQVDDYARSLANSVRRRLGIAGAANSSAALYAAPNAIAKDASGKRTGVVENYANNYFDLKKADEDNKVDFDKYLVELENQRKAKALDYESGIDEQLAGIQSQKMSLAGERARLLGGGYNGVRTAQQPYMDKYNSLSSGIDGLIDKYKAPVYQQRELTRANPTLRDYLVDKTAIKTDAAGNQDPYAPYSTLLKQDDEEQL